MSLSFIYDKVLRNWYGIYTCLKFIWAPTDSIGFSLELLKPIAIFTDATNCYIGILLNIAIKNDGKSI